MSALQTGLLRGSWDNALLLVGAFSLLLLGAELFTNGVEWLGRRLGVSESATGSILAAVGTALPETTIPIVAILQEDGTSATSAASEVGVGAILGAPFMLATVAMFVIGVSVLYFGRRRRHGTTFRFDAEATRRDLSFFLVGYTVAFAAALVGSPTADRAVGVLLVCLYLLYVRRSLASGELGDEGELDDLQLGALVEKGESPLPGVGLAGADYSGDPSRGLVALQTALALGLILGGARLFVGEVGWAAEAVGVPQAVLALLIAPLATELPEKLNSVIWISNDKDTLALGNITGAMAFQGTLPVTLGIVFTSWNLSLTWGTTGFLNGLSTVLAIGSGAVLYLRARAAGEGGMHPRPFLVGGLLYLGFIAVTLYHVLVVGLSPGG